MKIKTVGRKWARAWWIFLWGMLLSWFLGMPDGAKPLCLVVLLACGAGLIVSVLKLRCPYCGKGSPRGPAFWPSGKTQYCSSCGKPFVYDDEL